MTDENAGPTEDPKVTDWVRFARWSLGEISGDNYADELVAEGEDNGSPWIQMLRRDDTPDALRARAERAEAAVERLRALVAECYQCRTDNGGYIPSELGDRLGAALRSDA